MTHLFLSNSQFRALMIFINWPAAVNLKSLWNLLQTKEDAIGLISLKNFKFLHCTYFAAQALKKHKFNYEHIILGN